MSVLYYERIDCTLGDRVSTMGLHVYGNICPIAVRQIPALEIHSVYSRVSVLLRL